ncbi:MAG: cbb3-type cytochrome c oxidase subunit 3 [Porticoccaceae bacterium]|nr:cbb3-type cytochrome c oxidase subunit 3 [Porticoccaceae bacterium]
MDQETLSSSGALFNSGALFDSGTWSGIGTILALVAFIGICIWAYSGRNKARFDEAANLPFADEQPDPETGSKPSTNKDPDLSETDKVSNL